MKHRIQLNPKRLYSLCCKGGDDDDGGGGHSNDSSSNNVGNDGGGGAGGVLTLTSSVVSIVCVFVRSNSNQVTYHKHRLVTKTAI